MINIVLNYLSSELTVEQRAAVINRFRRRKISCT